MNKRSIYKIIGLVVAIAVLGGSAVRAVQVNESARDYALRVAADLARAYPSSEIAEKLLETIVKMDDEQLGGTLLAGEQTETNFREVGRIDVDENKVMIFGSLHGKQTASTASTTFSEKNLTGQDIFVTDVMVKLTGTVSTSFFFSMGTSTSGAVAFNAGNTSDVGGIIDDYEFPTSTLNVEYSNGYLSVIGGPTSSMPMKITSSTYITGFLQNEDAGTGGRCKPQICESVTSSARGYDIEYVINYFRLKDY